MQTEESAAQPDQIYPITYQAFGSMTPNLDLRGKGSLAIHPAGPTYVFSGKEQGLFSFGRRVEMEFRVDDIWDVAVDGRTVMFNTLRGKSGAKKRPFRFYCRDAATAAAVADLLPGRKEADFVEAQDFAAKLRSIPGDVRSWSSVTNLVIAANAVVFVIMAAVLGAGWLEVTDLMPYVRYGANNGGATTDGEWWRLITSMFMHYGVLHLALNMWALFQTGHLVEKLLGRLSYLLAYFGSGITGGLASIIWHGDKIWSAGASGAIFGVYGALFGYMLREKHTLPRSVFQPLFKSTIVFAGYNLLYGLSHPGIDNAAHIGGILGGFAIGWAVAVPIDPPLRAKLMAGRFRLGVAVAAVLIGGGVALAPRFDYRLVDELAWAGANKGQVEKEKDLLKSFGETLDRYRSTGSGDALTGLLRDELIPFYEHWRTQVAGLRLEPDRLTARRRTKLSKIFDLRIGNYQDLLVGMRKRDPMAMDRFLQEEKRTSEAIAKLSDGQ